jgi:predicted RNA-binding protein YlqC (UPF0109 family)
LNRSFEPLKLKKRISESEMAPRSRKISEADLMALTKLLDHMVSSIVNFPEEVKIRCEKGSHAVMLDFETNVADAKFVVGARGTNLDAIERLLHAAARTRGVQVRLRFNSSS